MRFTIGNRARRDTQLPDTKSDEGERHDRLRCHLTANAHLEPVMIVLLRRSA